MFIDSVNYSVVGVLKDFKVDQLFDPQEPAVLKLGKENRYQFLVLQANVSDLELVYAKTKDAWKKDISYETFHRLLSKRLNT